MLHDISLQFPARSVTALSGALRLRSPLSPGLAARFWDVTGGAVRLGGVDVRDMRTDEILGRISVVFQDVYLFHDSIEANIRMGKPDATMEEIMEAAKAAACHDFIMALPDGYQTIVGRGAALHSPAVRSNAFRLQGGRFLKDAPIVPAGRGNRIPRPRGMRVLIQQAISALVAEKTVIVIAHRLPVHYERGQHPCAGGRRVAESGTHEQLLARGGIYANLWAEQEPGWHLAAIRIKISVEIKLSCQGRAILLSERDIWLYLVRRAAIA